MRQQKFAAVVDAYALLVLTKTTFHQNSNTPGVPQWYRALQSKVVVMKVIRLTF